jgi:hypothetical protein
MQFLNFDVDNFNLDQLFNFNIEGNQYLFRLRFNSRDGWYFSIYDPVTFDRESEDNIGSKLYGEVKIMPFQNILRHCYDDKLPTGFLALFDTELGSFKDYKIPEYNEIGTGKRFILTYSTKQEMEDLSLERLL